MFTDTPAFSSYSIDDISKALEFYGTTLGLDAKRTPQGISVTLKGTTLFLYPKEDHEPATFTVLNFQVENIDAAADALIAKGITLENYDMGEMKADKKGIYRAQDPSDGPSIAWFKDPAGNILSILKG